MGVREEAEMSHKYKLREIKITVTCQRRVRFNIPVFDRKH